jgi:hypothetical protein
MCHHISVGWDRPGRRPVDAGKTKEGNEMNTSTEKITADNRRPGMPLDHTWLVRYDSHPAHGWLCCATFATESEAEAFAAAKEAPAPGQTWHVGTGTGSERVVIALNKEREVNMMIGGRGEEWRAVSIVDGQPAGITTFRPGGRGIGCGRLDPRPALASSELFALAAAAAEADTARRQAIDKRHAEHAAAQEIARAKLDTIRPAWAVAAILAEIIVDDSDIQTDYFGEHTEKSYLLAWSRSERDNFQEMRKAAAACKLADKFPELHTGAGAFRVLCVFTNDVPNSNGAAHWAGQTSPWHTEDSPAGLFYTRAAAEEWITAHPAPHSVSCDGVEACFAWKIREEETEHREKYSMGKGYYLQHDRSPWRIRKESTRYAGHIINALMNPEGIAMPEAAPAADPTAAPAAAACASGKPQVTENKDKGGIEIRFPAKPERSTLDTLKAAGWRWSCRACCWYTKDTPEARTFAGAITA